VLVIRDWERLCKLAAISSCFSLLDDMTEVEILPEFRKNTINEVNMPKRWFSSVLALRLLFEGEDPPTGFKAATAQTLYKAEFALPLQFWFTPQSASRLPPNRSHIDVIRGCHDPSPRIA